MAKKSARRATSERIEHEQRVAAANDQPHRRSARGDDVLDIRLENPLGRLNFSGKITTSEYEAGQRYRQIVLDYLHSIGAPYPFVQSQDAEFTISGIMRTPIDEVCEQRKKDYNGAYEALMSNPKRQRVAVATKRTVIYEMEPTEFDFELLKIGLKALANYFERGARSNVIPFNRFIPLG